MSCQPPSGSFLRSLSSSLDSSRSARPPPKNPMVTFSLVSVAIGGLHDLGEDAAGGGGVQERDARAADAGPGLLVDEAQARGLQPLELSVDVRRLVGDVVQARALLGQELPDRRVLAERREELDVVLADVEQHGLDALGLDGLAVDELDREVALVELERGVEVLDGDADVIDAGQHPPEASPWAGRAPARRRSAGGEPRRRP